MPLTIDHHSYTSKKAHSKDKTKKINFMIRMDLMKGIELLVPSGKRSEFVNQAIEGALLDYSRQKAYELMKQARERDKMAMSTEEILEAIRFGRK